MTAPFVVTQPLVAVPPPDGSAPGIDAGVLGLEARHTWYGEYGPVRLNHLWEDSGDRVVLGVTTTVGRPGTVAAAAIYPLTTIQGLHSRADADDNVAQLTGRMGEIPYTSLQRGKTVTYEGVVAGATLSDLRRAVAQLRRAFAGTSQTMMLVEPHPSYGTVPYAYFGRCTQLEVTDEIGAAPDARYGQHQRNFNVAVRQHDPRYFVWSQRTSNGHAAGAGFTVTDAGTAPADPVLTVRPALGNAVTTVEIHNDTTGAVIALDPPTSGLEVLSGLNGHVTVNFVDRTITNETGFSLARSIDIGSSDWWDAGVMGLAPGDNVLRLADPSDGTLDVAWLDASW